MPVIIFLPQHYGMCTPVIIFLSLTLMAGVTPVIIFLPQHYVRCYACYNISTFYIMAGVTPVIIFLPLTLWQVLHL